MTGSNMKTITFYCFDTVNTININNSSEEPLIKARELCYHYQSLFSRFEARSDIWRVNHGHGLPVSVSPETLEIVSLAILYSSMTSGAFDITVGSLSKAWGLGKEAGVPDDSAIRSALAATGSDKVIIGDDTVTCPEGFALDLGGIAKGYAADKIADMMMADGVSCGIINLGGDILTFGNKPKGEKWHVGLQVPYMDTGRYDNVVSFRGRKAVVTSGAYERGFMGEDGKWYNHIIDTRNGRPVENQLSSVTTVHRNAAFADALATACICIGREKAEEAVSQMDETMAYLTLVDGTTLERGEHFA